MIRSNDDSVALLTLTSQGTGTVNSPDQQNNNGRGVQVYVNITGLTGTGPTLTVTIEAKDAVSGVYVALLTSAALAATAMTMLTVYPGVTVAANVAASQALPRSWRVKAVVAGTSPTVTATIAAAVVA